MLLLLLACTAEPADSAAPLSLRAVSFNTGTSEGMAHDAEPDDGYTGAHATISDTWYGDGLAWLPAIEATRAFFEDTDADLVVFQEIFYSPECAEIPEDAQADFVCARWQAGDPTVAQEVLGEGWQVACHPGNPDKCAAVRARLGRFVGCDEDLCVEGLTGFRIEGCGGGARVGRGELALVGGGTLTLGHIHGSSGLSSEDEACRVAQVEQLFVDLGDGQPAANGEMNLVLGDLNTDPGRFAGFDPSAARWNDFVGEGRGFWWLTQVGEDAPGSYGGLADIDHVASDSLLGGCQIAGVSEGLPEVLDAVYFDHHPVICDLTAARPPY